MDIAFRVAKELRRAKILTQKRISYFKYNVQLKRERRDTYNLGMDVNMFEMQQRSVNVLDFDTNRDKDLYLLDIYSDRTQHGGNSETHLELKKTNTDPEQVFRKF